MKRCLDYADALRELWPPSVDVPSVAGSEQIRFPLLGVTLRGDAQPPFFPFVI
jgi:hypothetical protein